MKKRTVGTLLGFLAMFGVGALYYGMLTADAAAAMIAENSACMGEPHMGWIVFGNIMGAYMLVYAFDKMNVNDAKAGAYQGAMIMAIIGAFSIAFLIAQFSIFDLNYALVEWVVTIVHGAVGGAAVGAFNSRLN